VNKKKLKASATLTLLMAMTFLLCLFFLLDFMDLLKKKLYLERKENQLKMENYLACALLKHKINSYFPIIIARYIDQYIELPSEEFLCKKLRKIIENNPKFKDLSVVLQYQDLNPNDLHNAQQENNEIMKQGLLFNTIAKSSLSIMIFHKNKKIFSHLLSLNSIFDYSTKLNIQEL
jgi:hypothetical protein